MNKSTMNVMFSSAKEEWGTPQHVFDKLNEEFNFNTDVCALDENHKCDHYYTPETDGLSQDWKGACYCNPPYGKPIGKWLEKCYVESLKGTTVVALIPSRTDTKYWHDYCMKAKDVRFVKGRLKFGDSNNSAPFPSAVVVFKNHNNQHPVMQAVDYRTLDNIQSQPINPLYHPIVPFKIL